MRPPIGGRLTHSEPETWTRSHPSSPRTSSGTCPVGTHWQERSAVSTGSSPGSAVVSELGFTIREHDVFGNDEHVLCTELHSGCPVARGRHRNPGGERLPLPRWAAGRAVDVPGRCGSLGRDLRRLTSGGLDRQLKGQTQDRGEPLRLVCDLLSSGAAPLRRTKRPRRCSSSERPRSGYDPAVDDDIGPTGDQRPPGLEERY